MKKFLPAVLSLLAGVNATNAETFQSLGEQAQMLWGAPSAVRAPSPYGALNLPGARFSRASWYGGGERLNRRTASGEIFRPAALTAAHRTLPLGTKVAVSYGGRTVVVRINDRGPARWTGRDLDLSREAARQLGYISRGEARVTWAVVAAPVRFADASGWLARDTTSILDR